MANKKFWLVMLVVVLVFGMTVVGCDVFDNSDNRPYLAGGVSLDNRYPVVGETITASYSIYAPNPPVGTPTWTWYKTEENVSYLSISSISNKTTIGHSRTYTVTESDVGFYLWAELIYSGNKGSDDQRTLSTVMGIPATATVSVSIAAVRDLSADTYSSLSNHLVTVTLTLSDGRWNTVSIDTASEWITMTGTPSVSSWTVPYLYPSVSAGGRELVFTYATRSETTLSISSLTATLNTGQLSTMRSHTNVYNTLTTGTPSSASVSLWTLRY